MEHRNDAVGMSRIIALTQFECKASSEMLSHECNSFLSFLLSIAINPSEKKVTADYIFLIRPSKTLSNWLCSISNDNL